MTTVAEMIRELQTRFSERGISTPRLDAELLIGHVLDCTRAQVLARFPDLLSEPDLAGLDRLAERRLAGEPMAYILGRKEFLGFDLTVTPAVLTPRPETELLVEWAIAWLKDHPGASVVDVGTGSGAIAIGIALGAPAVASIVAIDISDAALDVARENASRLCPGRIAFQTGDLLTGFAGPADLVLANLPYLRPDQIDGNGDLAAEPRLALDGGSNGLDLITRLIRQLPPVLAPTSAVALEINPSQATDVSVMLKHALPGTGITVHQDLAGLDRFVTATRI